MRLAVLFDHLGPYHRARLAAAAKNAKILALEVRGRSQEYAWDPSESADGFDRITLLSENSLPGDLSTSLGNALDSFGPDVVVIPGWSGRAAFLAMSWCVRRRIPAVVMSESTAHDEARKGWQEWVKRRYLSLASAALVGGTPHRDYLRQLGMPDDRIFEGYDAVDNDYFARESERWRSADRSCPPYFLASNRFIRKKNLFRLLAAYARYRNRHNEERKTKNKDRTNGPWPLVLLGDGEDKAVLLKHARSLGLTLAERAPWESPTKHDAPGTKNEEPGTKNTREENPSVFLPGFRQIDELPRFYAHAGAFVHASTTEQWGLVVNEAMASGLPVVVSERCGCAPDLVKEGENGWTVDPFDEAALAEKFHKVALLPETERAALGAASCRIIANWGPAKFAEGLRTAAEKALASPARKAGWFDHLLLRVLANR